MPVTTAQENCQRCNGTGLYSGTRRDGSTYQGPCFACQGGGPGYARRAYRGNAARRDYAAAAIPEAAAIAPAAPRNRREQADLDRFAATYPMEWVWLVNNASTVSFAASLLNGIARYGNLTPRQLAAVQRNLPTGQHAPVATVEPQYREGESVDRLPSDSAIGFIDPIPAAPLADIRTPEADTMRREAAARRDAAHRAVYSAPVAPAPAMPTLAEMQANRPAPSLVNLDRVRTAMESAAASGLRKVRLTFGDVTMKLSGPSFRGGGRGMVLCYHNGVYQGYVDAQNTFRARLSHTATEATLDAFRAVGVDPQAAARTHGMDTGYCSCCRRLLTDPPSVMAGIGPVCIRRFGWSF